MSKYQAYPEYKNSGVEWLDKVPSHWNSVPIKYMALEPGSLFLDGNWIESKDISGDEIRYITTGNVGEGCYKEQGTGYITEEKFQQLNCTEVFEGDILISRLNEPIGRSCIVPSLRSRIVTSVDNVIFRADKKYNKKYIVHLFSSKDYFKHTSNLARGATMQRISRGLLGNIRVVAPTIDEQGKIANFLDHETAKIDTLIDKQQQLIQLLKEKRQAVISHAVTKGLNPNAPMRDSGVEWLGEVPEHWITTQIRHVLIGMEQGKSPECESREAELNEWGVLKTSCVNRAVYNSEANKALPSTIQPFLEYEVKKGDVLMSRASGSRDLIGSVAYVYETRARILLSDKIFRLHLNSKINRVFFSFLMQSSYMRASIERAISGAEGMANNITKSSIIGFKFALPPIVEQDVVTSEITNKLNVLDSLILKAQSAIKLMLERRTALISAAVTGKIDVRHWQAPASTQSKEAV